MIVGALSRCGAFLDAWGEDHQQVCRIRAWVMQSLSLSGLTPEDVPNTVQF